MRKRIDDVQKKINDLLKRTNLWKQYKGIKNDPVKRHELVKLAGEIDDKRAEEDIILLEQDGCFSCNKKYIKPNEREKTKSGKIICRRCRNRAIAIQEAHPDFKCKCGAYLPLPENINIWTSQRDGTWVCISCSHRKKTAKLKDIDIEGRIFVPVTKFKLNGHLLLVVRTRAALSVKQIAEYCGWSNKYYYDLQKANQGGEREVLTISTEAKNKIENAFTKFTGKRPEEWLVVEE